MWSHNLSSLGRERAFRCPSNKLFSEESNQSEWITVINTVTIEMKDDTKTLRMPQERHSVDSFLRSVSWGLSHGFERLQNLLVTHIGFFLLSDITAWEVKQIINVEFSDHINLSGTIFKNGWNLVSLMFLVLRKTFLKPLGLSLLSLKDCTSWAWLTLPKSLFCSQYINCWPLLAWLSQYDDRMGRQEPECHLEGERKRRAVCQPIWPLYSIKHWTS